MLQLQRTVGNAAVVSLHSTGVLPTAAHGNGAAGVVMRDPVPPVDTPVGRRTKRPVAELEQDFRKLIKDQRENNPVAAGNLEHWLDGKGSKKGVSLSWLRGYGPMTGAERKNQERFEKRAAQECKAVPAGGDSRFEDYWDARVSAWQGTELYYASGISQLRSTGAFTLTRRGDKVSVSGVVEHRWFDPYDWNPGAAAWIPGSGMISDDVGLDLKDAGIGHDYLLEVTYKQNLEGSYVIRPVYLPDVSSYVWSEPFGASSP